MTTWTLVHSEVSPLASSYMGVWRHTVMDVPCTPMLPTDWVTAMKAEQVALAPQMLVLQADVYVPQGHEADPANTLVHLDTMYGLNPALYPASTDGNVQAQQWQFLVAIGSIVGGGMLLEKALNKASEQGSNTPTDGGMSEMMGVMMPMMMMMMMMSMMGGMFKTA